MTTPFDLVLAEAVLAGRRETDRAPMNSTPDVTANLPLIGIGVDVHAFATEQDVEVEPRPLRLASADPTGRARAACSATRTPTWWRTRPATRSSPPQA